MRIRQVRPEFFTDPVTGHLPPAVQVTYIGLWCVADDAGYFTYDPDQIGALLYPYLSIRVRTRRISENLAELERIGRLIRWDCGCARIPTFESHQKIGGNKSFTVAERHRHHKMWAVHTSTDTVHTSTDKSDGKVSNGTVGNGTREADASGAASLGERLLANGVKPELVG